jgi:hypothetical protein
MRIDNKQGFLIKLLNKTKRRIWDQFNVLAASKCGGYRHTSRTADAIILSQRAVMLLWIGTSTSHANAPLPPESISPSQIQDSSPLYQALL